jgi:hypothetical protein
MLTTETSLSKWARGTLHQQPANTSDVWWCDVKKAPTVYMGGEFRCQLCGEGFVDSKNRHDFAVHIELEK